MSREEQCIHTFEIRYKLCRACAGNNTQCRCYEPHSKAKVGGEANTNEPHKHTP